VVVRQDWTERHTYRRDHARLSMLAIRWFHGYSTCVLPVKTFNVELLKADAHKVLAIGGFSEAG
jgi:hypothetical protein